jgi:hypothetical protein
VKTFGGALEVEWEKQEPMSLQGTMVHSIEFLKESDLCQNFVKTCPRTSLFPPSDGSLSKASLPSIGPSLPPNVSILIPVRA